MIENRSQLAFDSLCDGDKLLREAARLMPLSAGERRLFRERCGAAARRRLWRVVLNGDGTSRVVFEG